LREKLGDAYIRTIKGVGYTFNEKWVVQDQVI
jgi:DNA-binding response OmpR family regulator